ncbi:MAG TPA: zinc-binding dehydrogenase, partial [Clostridia bacterium]|nr:zinc-binding dehydrogenase [Clostridia bacterium]
SGVVEACGEGVTRVKPGDRVAGAPLLPCMRCEDCLQGQYALCKQYSFIGSRSQGSFAELVAMPETNAMPFDPSISFTQGALFEPATVALHGILISGQPGGQTVAVLGGGTIGLFALQWAKILGARRVVVFDLDPDRLVLAQALGADAVVCTAEADYEEKAMALTNGKGYETVLETSGAEATLLMAYRLAANKARACMIGTPHTDVRFSPKTWELLNRKEMRLTGSWMSYSAPFPGKEWSLTAHYFKTGQLKYDPRMIFLSFPLSQAAQAFALFKKPGYVKGRILLVNDSLPDD